jgi:hypothetical protein
MECSDFDNLYQSSCELVKFNHSLIESKEIAKMMSHLRFQRHLQYQYYLALDRYHHPFNQDVNSVTPLLKRMKAFDSERRICMAYYDSNYITESCPDAKIFVIEGQMPRNRIDGTIQSVHKAISMWESMINMMNTLNPYIIVGDMLQLQCYAGTNQVRFYGLWIMSSESKANVSEVCQGFGLQQLQYRYLRTCDSNYNGKVVSDIPRDHLSELFQSLIINYTNKRCDREKTIKALYQANIDVIDHDRCLVRCCIPSQQSV